MSKEFRFTEQATAGSVSLPVIAVAVSGTVTYAITAVSQGSQSFTFAGEHDGEFRAGDALTVAGSTGNDGAYTVASASSDGTHTTVVVVESLPSAVADGTLSPDVVGSITVAGDHRADIIDCDWFSVVGSTGNDGVKVASSLTFTGGNTVIKTHDGIADATADGTVLPSQYRASFTLPARNILREVVVVPVAGPWAATTAYLWMFDDNDNDYLSGLDLVGTLTAPFDAAHPTAQVNFGTLEVTHDFADNPSSDGIVGSLATMHLATSPASQTLPSLETALNHSYTGPGAQFSTDVTLHMTITTTLASSPVTPTGETVVRVTYATAPASTDAVFA